MTQLITPLEGSAETWREHWSEPRVPAELIPPAQAPLKERLRHWRSRHVLREQRAEQIFQDSRQPERGLPVAENKQVTGFLVNLFRHRKAMITIMLALNALAAVAGLLVPRILGALIDAASSEGTLAATLNGLALAVAGVVIIQAGMTFLARASATVFGQDVLASAREYVVRTVLQLPLGRVEGASSGDLVTRVTRDVNAMSSSVRQGVPEAVIASITALLTVVAMLLNSPWLSLPLIFTGVMLIIFVRRYLRRAPKGYITEGGTYSDINTTLTETVEGARTVEALGLQGIRNTISDEDMAASGQAERYTMTLRNLLFIGMDTGYQIPLVLTLVLGGYGYWNGWVSLGQITAAVLYIQQVTDPLNRLIRNLDRLQVGIASTTRLLGIAAVPQDREAGEDLPQDNKIVGEDLRFAYRADHDVLHGVNVELEPGERLAIVGPSGSGKSTLGRLLSGINRPRTGAVTVGKVELTSLPLPVLRTEVALVTQEHHVFVGTIRDNIVLAREDSPDDVVIQALRTVDAWEWVERLPEQLDTMIGSGRMALTPAQAQQIALARLVVADPHTLVLDEATSLIDPRTARHLEGSMAALLQNRAVVAIAHRLHTAHDADRIAVVIDGKIVELGSHDQLVAAEGEYASLWRAWTS